MEAFSERLLREHQPAWQAMQQHPFVTDIEQDRLPTVVFNRYLVFEGNFVATAIAILPRGQQSAGYSTAALADWRAECPG